MHLQTLSYLANYDLEVLPDLPAVGVDYTFRAKRRPSKSEELSWEVHSSSADWLTLKVKLLNGTSWTGKFEPGVEGVSGLYGTPSEATFCVVAKGQGYWVPAGAPEDYGVIPSFPIKNVIAVPQSNVIVFADYVRLVAFGANGMIWRTGSISWDGLEIREVTSNVVRGTGWDAPNSRSVEFSVDVATGDCRGGASPDMPLKGDATH